MSNLLERKEFCNGFPSCKSTGVKALFQSLLKESQTSWPPCLPIGNCFEPVATLLNVGGEEEGWGFAKSQLYRSIVHLWCCSVGLFFPACGLLY